MKKKTMTWVLVLSDFIIMCVLRLARTTAAELMIMRTRRTTIKTTDNGAQIKEKKHLPPMSLIL